MIKKEIVFATNNTNKLAEVRQLAGEQLNILSLADIGCHEELPETHDTLEENAFEKADYVYRHYGKNCFAEDTGLETEALHGAPGVFSARYAGSGRSADDNIALLLKNLEGKSNRRARFRTVVSLIENGKEMRFEGTVAGTIIHEKRGKEGFGYDPVFVPDGYAATFAEMGMEEKSRISHRGEVIRKLVSYLLASIEKI